MTKMTNMTKVTKSTVGIIAVALLVGACGSGAIPAGSVTTRPSLTVPPASSLPSATTTPSAPTSSVPTDSAPTSSAPTTVPAFSEAVAVNVFFLHMSGGNHSRVGPFLVPVARVLEGEEGIARVVTEMLISGPTPAEVSAGISNAVPDTTLILGLTIAEETAIVDLSGDFESGGGNLTMRARLAQLVYTLTQFQTVERVELRLDGRPVEVFSAEGILIDGPQTRADHQDLLPGIMPETPGWGATVSAPLTVAGVAAAFEAVFWMQLLDQDGNVIAEPDYVMTDNGNGWGNFEVTLDFEATGDATLVVLESSAEDGSPISQREIPLHLIP